MRRKRETYPGSEARLLPASQPASHKDSREVRYTERKGEQGGGKIRSPVAKCKEKQIRTRAKIRLNIHS